MTPGNILIITLLAVVTAGLMFKIIIMPLIFPSQMNESKSYDAFVSFRKRHDAERRELTKKRQQREYARTLELPRVRQRIINNSPGTIDFLRDHREVNQLAKMYHIQH